MKIAAKQNAANPFAAIRTEVALNLAMLGLLQ